MRRNLLPSPPGGAILPRMLHRPSVRALSALLLLVPCLLWGACAAGAQSALEPVVMVFGAGYPPFYNHSEPDGRDNIREGMFVDFLAAFGRAHPEFPIRRVVLPRARLDDWLASGRAHAFSLNNPDFVPRSDREHIVFSHTLWRTSDHVLVRAGEEFPYSRPEDLTGRRMALVYGNGYGPLDPLLEAGDIAADRPYTAEAMYRMLARGRADAAVGNRHTHAFTLHAAGLPEDALALLDPPLMEFDLAVAVRKDRRDFLAALNAFIDASRASGLLDTIEREWMQDGGRGSAE